MKLRQVVVGAVAARDEARFQQLMQAHHYLGALPKIGQTLWYVARWCGDWVALVGFIFTRLEVPGSEHHAQCRQTNEIGTFIPLIASLDITGKTLTADALLTQRKLARHLLERQAHYLCTVKANQPNLLADFQLAFKQRGEPDFRENVTLAHGRLERRTITCSTGTGTKTAAASEPAMGSRTPRSCADSPSASSTPQPRRRRGHLTKTPPQRPPRLRIPAHDPKRTGTSTAPNGEELEQISPGS